MNYLGPIESAGPNGTMIILYHKLTLDLTLNRRAELQPHTRPHTDVSALN